MPNKNEVGAAWKKENEKGEYLSLSVDLPTLLDLTGGEITKVNVQAFPIDGEKLNPKAPDYRLMFYPKKGIGRGAQTVHHQRGEPKPVAEEPPLDDDIPF